VDLDDLDWQGMAYPGMDLGPFQDDDLSGSAVGGGGADESLGDLGLPVGGSAGRGSFGLGLDNETAMGEFIGDDFFDDEVDTGLEDYEAELGAQIPASSGPYTLPPAPPPTPPSSPSPQASFVSPPSASHGSTENQCRYKGVACFCTTDQHRVDPSLSASSSLHVDRNCKIMDVLGLSFHRYHRYLICGCGCFLPIGKLIDHYKREHPDILRDQLARYANKELLLIVEHFVASFDIPSDQTAISFTPTTFNGPIAGIAEPVRRFTCLACGVSLKSDFVAKKHWTGSCKAAQNSTLDRSERTREEWTQFPFGPFFFADKSKRMGCVVVPHNRLDNTPIPVQPDPPSASGSPAERYLVPDGLDSFRPPWLEALRWATWRDRQIEASLSLQTLLSFCALPTLYINAKKPKFSSPPTEEEKLAWAAGHIQHRLKKMMEDANTFLTESNGELRANLTPVGYVVADLTSGCFRTLMNLLCHCPALDLNSGNLKAIPSTRG
jgi:hypothetical protein